MILTGQDHLDQDSRMGLFSAQEQGVVAALNQDLGTDLNFIEDGQEILANILGHT